MTTFHVDAERGNDGNDGLSEVNAVKTVTQVNSISGTNDIIIFYPGDYFSSTGVVRNSRDNRAQFPGTVIIYDDTVGRYGSIGSTGTFKATGMVFRNFDDLGWQVLNSLVDGTFTFTDCRFENCQQILERIAPADDCIIIATRVVFDSCGGGQTLFEGLNGLGQKFDSCTFYNSSCGSEDMLDFSALVTADLDDFKNNIIHTVTADHIFNFAQTDADTIYDSVDFDTYRESTFTLATGFAVTGTGEKALLTNLQADTSAEPSGRIDDPGFVDVLKGLFAVLPGSNSDRTGFGNSTRGASGVGLGMSTNIAGATEWDNSTIVPAGESVLVSGNWEHNGTDSTVVTIETPEKDLLAIYKIDELRIEFENDAPEGIVDTTLADGKRTIEWRFGTSSPLVGAYAEVNLGDATLNATARFVQFKITERNDG